MTTFNFTDRASYKAFRLSWKIGYNELTLAIRETRKQIKQAYADGKDDRASILQSQKQAMRNDARQRLAHLAEAKIEAQRQYVEQRDARQAA